MFFKPILVLHNLLWIFQVEIIGGGGGKSICLPPPPPNIFIGGGGGARIDASAPWLE